MKNILPIILMCFGSLVYANQKPVVKDADEQIVSHANTPLFFEEEDENTEGADQANKPTHALPFRATSLCEKTNNPPDTEASYISWKRFKANFGIEKVFVRFPQKPIISQSNTLLTAYAWDYGIMYSFSGYFPPVSNIHSGSWFDEILHSLDNYPFKLVSYVIFEASNGDRLMDYTAHDYVQNTILKARAIATPFNGYIFQCVKPYGARDYFDYFIDNYYIRCECD